MHSSAGRDWPRGPEKPNLMYYVMHDLTLCYCSPGMRPPARYLAKFTNAAAALDYIAKREGRTEKNKYA